MWSSGSRIASRISISGASAQTFRCFAISCPAVEGSEQRTGGASWVGTPEGSEKRTGGASWVGAPESDQNPVVGAALSLLPLQQECWLRNQRAILCGSNLWEGSASTSYSGDEWREGVTLAPLSHTPRMLLQMHIKAFPLGNVGLSWLQGQRRMMQTETPVKKNKKALAKKGKKGKEKKEEKRWPVEILIVKKKNVLEVGFDDGKRFAYPAELLRVESPSADNQRVTSTGEVRVVGGKRPVRILGIEAIGNYALRVKFDDLHDTGIYTWAYLYELGANKIQRIRAYLKALKHSGLSRDPPRTHKAKPDCTSRAVEPTT